MGPITAKGAAVESGAARILFVTGKGGTGKSFLSRSLARAAAGRGLAVALVRMDDGDGQPALGAAAAAASTGSASRASTARPDGARPLPYTEIALDEREALESFLVRILRLGFVARRLLDSRTFSAVAAAAPGVSDLVRLLGITALARPAGKLDVIVVDAPATGHSVPLLTAPARVLELAPLGPVAREARMAHAIVGNPSRFTPIIVTTPEELAVTEALALHEQLVRAAITTPRVVVNGVWPSHLEPRDADWLLSAAASTDAALHWKRLRRQLALIDVLQKQVGPCRTLPFAFQDGDAAPADVAAVLHDVLGYMHSGERR